MNTYKVVESLAIMQCYDESCSLGERNIFNKDMDLSLLICLSIFENLFMRFTTL